MDVHTQTPFTLINTSLGARNFSCSMTSNWLDVLYLSHIVLEIFLGAIKLRGRCVLKLAFRLTFCVYVTQPLTCFRSVCTSHCRCSRDTRLQERRSSNVRSSSCILHPIHDRSFIYCLVTQHGGHGTGPTGLCCSSSFPWRCCGLIHVRLVWRRDQIQEGSRSAPSTRCRVRTARA